MASSDDEDLKRAIALSLQDSKVQDKILKPGESAGEAIYLSSDGEATTDDDETTDDESMSQTEARNLQKETRNANPDKTNGTSTAPNTSRGTSFLGMDRKKMEEERLARKRKVSVSPPPPRKVAKTSTSSPITSLPPAEETSTKPAPRDSPHVQAAAQGQIFSGSRFLEGTVMKTWAFGHPRIGDDIKLEEVLQKNDLSLAVLSSFQWDMDWLLAKLDMRSTHVTLVMQAKDDATKQQYRRETACMPNLRLCFPSMEGQVNCMHSKLMLLSHSKHLRVAVPTANLVPYDWGESGGIMENSVFLIDLPRVANGSTSQRDMTLFGEELVYFCEALGLDRTIINSIYGFDFSATKNLAFVHTIGGAHLGDSWRRTGYCGLGRAVQKLGLASDRALTMDFVTSSVGSLNIDFLAMLYLAAQGDDGRTEYEWRNPPTRRSKAAKGALPQKEAMRKILEDEIRENFHIYFPTSDTILYVRRANTEIDTLTTPAPSSWAYIGSANCSESAWGRLSKDRTTKAPKLNCRNWECGVIVPVPYEDGSNQLGNLKEFKGSIPVPMQYPGEPYGNRKPWYHSEQ
ncbi:tyrosyl-DNA phosphodiesterase 1, partial [Lecanoromycetidae sp. Uapishka_2]